MATFVPVLTKDIANCTLKTGNFIIDINSNKLGVDYANGDTITRYIIDLVTVSDLNTVKDSIPEASSSTPKANGTAAAGISNTYARADHVHPVQTTITGNAGSATKLETTRTVDGVSFDGSANITHYGICSTAAGTAAKTVSLTGFTLATGASVKVKFSNTNSIANPTLNVNDTGAKAIYYKGAAISTSDARCLKENYVYEFVYNGTQYDLVGEIDTNTTYTNASLGQGYGTCTTAEATTAKVVTLSSYSLTIGGIVTVKFTYAVPASATMNINNRGAKAIYYHGAAITADVIKAGDTATFIYDGTQYHLISIDRSSAEIFIAEYNVTTYGEVEAAYNNGQPVIVKYDNAYYYLTEKVSDVAFIFISLTQDTIKNIIVYSDDYASLIGQSWLGDTPEKLVFASGGTMTGALVAQNNINYTTKQVRNVLLVADGNTIPSGSNGDICLIYKA